jgi:hypothetical protein
MLQAMQEGTNMRALLRNLLKVVRKTVRVRYVYCVERWLLRREGGEHLPLLELLLLAARSARTLLRSIVHHR